MDSQQLTQGLKQALFVENHRIVFWYDADQSFAEELPLLDLPNVHVLNMQDESTFGLKLKLELEDTQGKYLLYFPCAEPEADDDWLLDIKLYSRSFYADKVSLIFNELGLIRRNDLRSGSGARLKPDINLAIVRDNRDIKQTEIFRL